MYHSKFVLKALTAALVLASTSGMVFAKGYKGDFKGEACPQPPMLKTGFYVGAQAGYESWKVRKSATGAAPGFFSGSSTTTWGANGWVGGLMLGYGALVNEWFYLGGEVFANWQNASVSNNEAYVVVPTATTFNASDSFSINNSYGVGLLPGIKISAGTMPYIRLGWNWANVKSTEGPASINGTSLGTFNKSGTVNGFVFGIGTEMLIVDNWSARGEFDHTWYSDIFNACNHMPSDNQFTVGVVYHIG